MSGARHAVAPSHVRPRHVGLHGHSVVHAAYRVPWPKRPCPQEHPGRRRNTTGWPAKSATRPVAPGGRRSQMEALVLAPEHRHACWSGQEMAVQHVGGFFEGQARMLHPGEWPVNAGRLPQREIVNDPPRAVARFEVERVRPACRPSTAGRRPRSSRCRGRPAGPGCGSTAHDRRSAPRRCCCSGRGRSPTGRRAGRRR